jgi:transcriptional regulator with XRE-family HTH domain
MAETSAQDRVDSRSSQPEGLRELLRSWRREHGLTQRQAARFFRCSAGSWASWEMGVVPNPSTLRRLAVVMAVPLGQLRAAAGPDRVRRPQTCGDDTTTPLAAARISRGLSQTVVADRLSISVPTLSRWEGGEFRPHPADYPRIAEVFDLPVAEVARWFDTYPTRQARSVGRLRGLAHEWRGRGHSDAAIADVLGVDRERLRQWGTGRVGVPHEVWERLCEHLDLDPAQDRLRLRVRPAPAAPTSPLARLRIAPS